MALLMVVRERKPLLLFTCLAQLQDRVWARAVPPVEPRELSPCGTLRPLCDTAGVMGSSSPWMNAHGDADAPTSFTAMLGTRAKLHFSTAGQ